MNAPLPPVAAVVPSEPTKASEERLTPVVVVISDPPETATSGLTRIVMETRATAPTESVAVIVSM